jgi:hypothetical protein
MTHQVLKIEARFTIQNLASGCTYGSFETFSEALEALTNAGLADQAALASPANY